MAEGLALTVADRVAAAFERVAAACRAADRPTGSVAIVAAAKGARPEDVAAAIRAGIAHVGENRVLDGAARRAAVEALQGGTGARWHLIGALQTNKARRAVAAFDRIDTLGSLRLAGVLDALALERGRPLPVLLQVDLSDDPGRNGFAADALVAAAKAVASMPGLSPEGLMAIAPLGLLPTEAQAAFARVASLSRQLAREVPQPGGWATLSMGMSGDLEAAVAAGATEVRLGTALFGPRPADG